MASDREHYFWIDALRGFAAIIVLISHVSLFGLYGYEHTLATFPPTRILWAGHQAVILFFVISGFALFLLFESMARAGDGWLKFILVRFLRLYPPYLASLVLALLVLNAPGLFGISPPANMPIIANGNMTLGTLLGHLFMIGDFDTRAINPPIWSLVHEARLCLLFPVIYLLVEKGTRRTAAILSVAWLVIACVGVAREYHYTTGFSAIISVLGTTNPALMFFIGALIAKYRVNVVAWVSARRPSTLIALMIISIVLFMYSHGYSWPGWAPNWVLRVSEIFTAIASAYFVACAISLPVPTKRRTLGFLGTIAYSLYLVHQVVIMGVLLLFYGRYEAPVLWIISISASLGAACVFYLAVEAPSVAASRAVRSRPTGAAAASADDASSPTAITIARRLTQ